MPPLSIHLTKYIINKKVFYLDFLTTSTIFFSFSYLEISFEFLVAIPCPLSSIAHSRDCSIFRLTTVCNVQCNNSPKIPSDLPFPQTKNIARIANAVSLFMKGNYINVVLNCKKNHDFTMGDKFRG